MLDTANFIGTTVGPTSAIKRLRDELRCDEDRSRWVAKARVEALVGGCQKSLPSVKSGLRCYMAFASTVLRKPRRSLPPSVDDLLAWSMTFRCAETFSNYLGHIRLGCLLAGVATDALNDPALKRAKQAIRKRRGFRARKKLFIQLEVVSLLMCSEGLDTAHCMLYLAAYVVMLRLPSEALPIARGANGCASYEHQNILYMDKDELCLKLKSRKNRPDGSLLRRSCWCKSCALTCPVHVLWHYVCSTCAIGQQPFRHISAKDALYTLRSYLLKLEIPDAKLYRCHDLRRGHAQDLVESGANLAIKMQFRLRVVGVCMYVCNRCTCVYIYIHISHIYMILYVYIYISPILTIDKPTLKPATTHLRNLVDSG